MKKKDISINRVTEIKRELQLKRNLKKVKKIIEKNYVLQLLKRKYYSINFISGQKAVTINNDNSTAKR